MQDLGEEQRCRKTALCAALTRSDPLCDNRHWLGSAFPAICLTLKGGLSRAIKQSGVLSCCMPINPEILGHGIGCLAYSDTLCNLCL